MIWKRKIPRRDILYAVGIRCSRLNANESALAWQAMAGELEFMREKDMPKFRDVIKAIRSATIYARKKRKK